MSTELLAGGGVDSSPAPRWHGVRLWLRRQRLWLVLAAVLVVLLLLADQWEQQRELDQLTAGMQSGEEQISTTDRYFDGVLAYYSPVIFRESPPQGFRQGFQKDVGQGADAGLLGIDETTHELDGITVLPWHRHLLAARSTYQQRIVLWRAFLTHTTSDANALFDPVPGFRESATATTAALRLAVPWSGGASDRARVETVLTETP